MADIYAIPDGYTRVDPNADINAIPAGYARPGPSAADQTYGTDPNASVMQNVGKMAGDLGQAADNGVRQIANGFTGNWADHFAAAMGNKVSPGSTDLATEQAKTAAADTALGPVETTINHMLGAGAQAALIPGGAVSTLPRAVATGGALNAANTQAESFAKTGEAASPWETAISSGVGMLTGGIGHKLTAVFQRPRLDAQQQTHADVFQNEGIPVTAGQATGDTAMLKREGGAAGLGDFLKRQATAFSSAVARRVGIAAPDGAITIPRLNQAFSDAGTEMNRLAARYDITDLNTLNGAFRNAADVARHYHAGIGPNSAPIVDNTVTALGRAARAGTLTGARYQEITSDLASAARTNPALAETAHELRAVIDDAMHTSIRSQNTQDANAWQAVRQQYKNLVTVEDALGRTGKAGGTGASDRVIVPNDLAAAAKNTQGKRGYVRGRTDFQDLADAGRSILGNSPKAPQSSSLLDQSSLLGGGSLGASAYYMGHPQIGAAIGTAGILPVAASAALNKSNLALRSVPTLSPFANLAGAAGGNAAAGQLQDKVVNPFTKAMGY